MEIPLGKRVKLKSPHGFIANGQVGGQIFVYVHNELEGMVAGHSPEKNPMVLFDQLPGVLFQLPAEWLVLQGSGLVLP